MDDQTSQFFIIVGEVCTTAASTGLEVDVVTAGGRSLSGVPETPRSSAPGQLDDTGFVDSLVIGGQRIPLHDVVELSVRRTGEVQPADVGDASAG